MRLEEASKVEFVYANAYKRFGWGRQIITRFIFLDFWDMGKFVGMVGSSKGIVNCL